MPEFTEPQTPRAVPSPSASTIAAYLRASSAVALRMDEITRGGPWETFRAGVEDLLARAREILDGLQTQMSEGADVGDRLTAVKLQVRYFKGRIDAFAAVLDLPEALIDHDKQLAEATKSLTDPGARA